MAILKCKYCGGNISPFPDNALGICDRCDCVMTLPVNSQNAAAHNCGNYLRRTGKFDQALAVYQKLLQQDMTDAESHWCSALCRFGVQYDLDKASGEYLPTIARPESGGFLQSGGYLAALVNSGGAVHLQYEKEAARIAARLGEDVSPAPSQSPALLLKQGYWHLGQKEWSMANTYLEQVLSAEPENAMAYLGLLLSEFQCSDPKALINCGQDITGSEHYKSALKTADESLSKFLETCSRQSRQQNHLTQTETVYQAAVEAMETASTGDAYRHAARLFGQLKDYKNSQSNAKECLRRAEILRREDIYRAAIAAKAQGQMAQAGALFAKIPGWRDANVQAVECRQRSAALEAARPKKEPGTGMLKRIAAAVFLMALLCVGAYLVVTRYLIPQQKYNAAEALLEAGHRAEAIEAFQNLGSFKDSPDRALGIQIEWFNQAEQLLSAGDSCRAAIIFGSLRDFQDARERSLALWEEIIPPQTITAGSWYTAALRSDKTAVATGDDREKQCWVGSWLNIRSISAGREHTVGLRTDGTAVAAGYNSDGRGDVDQWRDMVAVRAGQWHTVGLRSNGTAIGIGCDNDGRIDLDGWQDLKNISAGRNHTVGLKVDGTAMAAGDNTEGQCNIQGWNQLTAISAGGTHTLGLKRDGTVVAAGGNGDGQCNVSDWNGIVAVSAGYYHSVGLKADGTVVAVGFNDYGQCDVAEWTDIVAICAGGWHTVGLKADGSIVAVGRNEEGQCEILGWDNMMVPA